MSRSKTTTTGDVGPGRLKDHLERAMSNAEDPETIYHLRQALQRLEIERDGD